MKYAVLILALFLGQGITAQTPKSKPTPAKKPAAQKPRTTSSPLTEKDQFAKASAHELAADRIAALEKFVTAFPQSENRQAAADLIGSSRALMAEEKLLSGNAAEAVALFKKVVDEAPLPIPNELFNESISKIPSMLFRHGERAASFEIAKLIESKVENNSAHLLELASFYVNIENGSEAMRVAAKAAAKDPTSAAVYRTLALAHRINFDVDAAANAYAKALELEPASSSSRRGLAEMKRALGKSDEAATLYRDLLAKNEADVPARTGLVLALFDSGKRDEAESEMATALQRAPSNFVLLAGAAYWYASRGIGEKAVELAEKALAIEPRYVWSHIALGRGLMARGKPVPAEQVLVRARAHGNFPTLEYEIASARLASGFFRDAVEDLSKQFTLTDGGVKTNLGGRVAHVEKTLADLVAFERKASIFTPVAADTVEASETLRALLELDKLATATAAANDAEIAVAVDAFVKGADKMKVHRQIYAAGLLLQKRVAVGKALELTKAATGNSDTGLDVADPGAAVMASELYESRVTAFRKGEYLLVPEVPRQTLSAILRGRIEELTGWAFYQQGNFPDAVIRLRRSISVMPDKSAWWRSSMWRLGSALASDGKDAEALHAYIESYKTDKPDFGKYAIVESLYLKINGTTDGLEAKIGAERVAAMPISSPIAPAPEAPAAASTSEVVQPAAVATPEAGPIDVKPEPLKPTSETIVETRPTEVSPSPLQVPVKTEPVSPTVWEVEAKKEPRPLPTENKTEVGAEPRPVEASVAATSEKAATTADKPAIVVERKAVPKPLFEPIIITIPSNRPARIVPEKKNTTAGEKDGAVKAAISSGDARPRVIDGQDVTTDEPTPCQVALSQDNVSLINGGGSVGILVNLDAPGDIKTLAAISSSPKDVEVILEPEIGGVPDRRLYVIRSTSAALGVYQIAFVAPCGKKDLIVTVR